MELSALKKDELVDLAEQQSEKIAVLEQQLRLLLSKTYGSSSEKVSADQLALFNSEIAVDVDNEDDDTITVSYQRKKRGKRKPCDKNLERKRIEYTLSDSELQCDCGAELKKIGEQQSEQYDMIPAQYIVIEHVQHKYACSCCKSKKSIKTAKKTPQILPKTNAAAGLLSYIATAKYVDSVPLNRQEKQHERGGIHLPRNTMSRWLIQLANAALPIINLLDDAIRAGPYTQCDETTIQVLKELDRKASSKSYIWVRHGGLPGQEAVLYNYHPSRSSKVVINLFEGCHGYVQCDGYAAYNVLEKQGITLVGCMAHARRKFNDALQSLSSKEAAQKAKAATALTFFKKLYAIEKECKKLSSEERHAFRQEKSIPLLNVFKEWLDTQVILPKSPTGIAINYTLNQWRKLIRYCDDGILEIDNNRDERAVRPVAIGRRNWLFADTPKGAHTSARFYSLIETCKLHGHEPYAYLKHIFKELPLATTVEDYEALLPWCLDAETLKQSAKIV